MPPGHRTPPPNAKSKKVEEDPGRRLGEAAAGTVDGVYSHYRPSK
jgi:hypothetical protein